MIQKKCVIDGKSVNVHMSANYDSEKKTILFIHGLAMSSKMYFPLIKKLGYKYNYIIPDLPGAGNSEPINLWNQRKGAWREENLIDRYVQIVHSVLKQLQIERCYLYGMSLGGIISVNLLVEYPELFERAIIQGVPISSKYITRRKKFTVIVLTTILRYKMFAKVWDRMRKNKSMINAFVESWAKLSPNWRNTFYEVVGGENMKEIYSGMDPYEFYAISKSILASDLEGDMKKIDHEKVIFIMAKEDKTVRPYSLVRIAELNNNLKSKYIIGGGHNAEILGTESVLDVINEWFGNGVLTL